LVYGTIRNYLGDDNMTVIQKKKPVEFRIVDDEELPPIVVTMNENDEPKVIINTYHRIWISLNRKLIAGIFDALPEKVDYILDGYLREQRQYEKMDKEMI
tara:strand:+ start:192 stop:491 length:300 start_codon:yes stop_codon:yes gene_type:complete